MAQAHLQQAMTEESRGRAAPSVDGGQIVRMCVLGHSVSCSGKRRKWILLKGALISNSGFSLTFPDSDKTPRLALVYSQELMAGDRAKHCELDQEKYDAHDNVKIICLGDSAVGKSKYDGRLGKKKESQNGLIRKVLQK